MRHRSRTIKFRHGQDANQMLGRKLLINFLTHGKITTTQRKARFLKPQIERFVTHAKAGSQSSYNEMLKMVASHDIVKKTIAQVAPLFKDRSGGTVTSKRLNVRASDGALTVRLDWTVPVVYAQEVVPAKVAKPAPTPKPVKKVETTKKNTLKAAKVSTKTPKV